MIVFLSKKSFAAMGSDPELHVSINQKRIRELRQTPGVNRHQADWS